MQQHNANRLSLNIKNSFLVVFLLCWNTGSRIEIGFLNLDLLYPLLIELLKLTDDIGKAA
jgi:hypothetical protein